MLSFLLFTIFSFTIDELEFFYDYVNVMGPLAQTLDLLQSEEKGFMGYLLPSFYGLKSKLANIQEKSTYCEPHAEAFIAGIDKRFGTMMRDPKLLAASLIHPHFKTDWLIPNELIAVGKLCNN